MPTVPGEDKARGRISVQSEWSQHIDKHWNLRYDRGRSVVGSERGGGTRAHPSGPVAGAKAFRQAIGATLQGIPLEQAAAEHEELHIALEEWVDPFKGLEM